MKHVDSNVRERALRLNFETAVFQRFALMPTTPVCSSPRCCLGRDADGASRVWLFGEFDLAAAPEVDAALWQAKAKSDRVVEPKSHAYLNSTFGNHDHHRRVQEDPSVVIHPDDAAARGIADGVAVRVFNERGEFTVLAKPDAAVQPGVVVSSLGGWRKHSPGASTPAAVNSTRFADLGNAPTFSDTLVEVRVA